MLYVQYSISMRTNLLVSFTKMWRMSQWLNISDGNRHNQRFASGLYPILDRKQLAVALSVFGARSSDSDPIPHTFRNQRANSCVFRVSKRVPGA